MPLLLPALLSALPVVTVLLALALGLRSLSAALLGTAAAGLAIGLGFPIPPAAIPDILIHWLPILAEVLLIVAGGLLLSETLRHAGAQAALADWLRGRAGHGVGAVLLVVHGITPFAESVTGFGIGVTIGIPLLACFGLPARTVAVIGLLGLCAVPWGSMAPGTLIAATLADIPFQALGVRSACLSVIPFAVTGVVAAWLASAPDGRGRAVWQGILSGLVLTLAVTAVNAVIGTPPAGALGALVVIALHLLWAPQRGRVSLGASGLRAVQAYGVLLGGVLIAGGLTTTLAGLSGAWRYLASPALWLFVATAWFARGVPPAPPLRKAWTAWVQVAPVTGLFIGLGVLMAVSGMAAFLARTLAGAGTAYLAAAPFVAAAGGFVTGSNSGANAMFAATQAAIARALGVDVLWFMAVHNVAAAFLLMASPGKIEMAVQLAGGEAARQRRWIQTTILGVAAVVVVALAAANVGLATLR
ncbi:L-lactate permease [Methylobacterium sp. E-066]|uniref:L-lactate permease n=1 Tax=Methylobacterium sp. E-066 TaxID=2836584 RepID=UPI001FB9E692|nr:L-lactate permease [Methylobacterium sp. E-066]MCJ2143270.1 L-lactate permease [Methylobacterium sp. E-066]